MFDMHVGFVLPDAHTYSSNGEAALLCPFKIQAVRWSLGLHTGMSVAHSKDTVQQAGDLRVGGWWVGWGGGVLPRPLASLFVSIPAECKLPLKPRAAAHTLKPDAPFFAIFPTSPAYVFFRQAH
jgi:hypothetical protein